MVGSHYMLRKFCYEVYIPGTTGGLVGDGVWTLEDTKSLNGDSTGEM